MTNERNISRIRAYAASPEMPAARYTGRDEPTKRDIEIVRLTLANGIEGVGCVDTVSRGAARGGVVREIRSLSADILGRSVNERIGITESLSAGAGDGPWEGVSILDCAMWDAYARCEGQPLWLLLGGFQERIDVYASTAAHLSIDDYLDDVRACESLGYRAVKLHLNTDPDFDLELVSAVAAANADNGLRLMVDLEERYEFDQALRLGEALNGLPYDWMEAPLDDRDIDGYAELNRALAIDVLPAGNTLIGLDNWNEGLRRGAWSRLRCDVTTGGGITTVRKGMALARSLHRPVELQSFGFQPTQQANLHTILGLGGSSYFEHPAPSAPYDYATRNPLTLDADGSIRATTGHGFGLDTDWEAIAADAFETFDSMN